MLSIKKTNPTRRDAFRIAGGTMLAVSAGTTGAIAATSETEIERYAALVGTRYSVGENGGTYVLDRVDAMAPRVRPEGKLSNRAPFVLVFRHEAGETVTDGTHSFRAALSAGATLMVSSRPETERGHWLEAVFN